MGSALETVPGAGRIVSRGVTSEGLLEQERDIYVLRGVVARTETPVLAAWVKSRADYRICRIQWGPC